MDEVQTRHAVAQELAGIVGKTAEELETAPTQSFADDLGMTSINYFLLIAALEERLGVSLDYGEFITAADTLEHASEYLTSITSK